MKGESSWMVKHLQYTTLLFIYVRELKIFETSYTGNVNWATEAFIGIITINQI